MKQQSNPEAGVTLIEILIAVSLLSLLSVGMLIAMRVGFNTLDKVNSRLLTDRRVSYARRILESEVAGFTYTTAVWHPGTPTSHVVPFTQWESSTMRFVTSYSLQDSWRGRAQMVALQVIPGAEGQGVRLIVNETPYGFNPGGHDNFLIRYRWHSPLRAGNRGSAIVRARRPARVLPVLLSRPHHRSALPGVAARMDHQKPFTDGHPHRNGAAG